MPCVSFIAEPHNCSEKASPQMTNGSGGGKHHDEKNPPKERPSDAKKTQAAAGSDRPKPASK